MNTRSKALSALASAGILAAGWGAATAAGNTLTGAEATTPTTANEPTISASARSAQPARPSLSPGSPSTRASSTSSSSSTSSTGPGSSSSASSGTTGTFTGSTETHRYGSVAVTVTLDHGRITALSEKVVSDGDHHSQRINSQAVPILKQQLIGTDGTSASTISGATYTTEAYLTSLQSALDKAA